MELPHPNREKEKKNNKKKIIANINETKIYSLNAIIECDLLFYLLTASNSYMYRDINTVII